jgi:hypothetical protein
MTPFPTLTDLVGVRMAGPLLHSPVGGDRSPLLTDLVGVRMAGPLLHSSVGGDRHPYCATSPQISAQGDN